MGGGISAALIGKDFTCLLNGCRSGFNSQRTNLVETLAKYPYAPGVKTERPETSRQSATRIASRAATLREKAFIVLKGQDLTADEVADALGEDRLAIRPRISELSAQNRIEDSGQRRENISGHNAVVWTIARPKLPPPVLKQVNLFEILK